MPTNTDCDDTNTTIYPGATEYCNSKDNDCNGLIDDNAADASTWYADFDRDDFGDAANSLYHEQPFDYILQLGDCDDTDDVVNPDAPELCNAIDDNCDGLVDNNTIDCLIIFFDADGDGFGDTNDCLRLSGNRLAMSSMIRIVMTPTIRFILRHLSSVMASIKIAMATLLELDLDGNGYLACEESIWFRTVPIITPIPMALLAGSRLFELSKYDDWPVQPCQQRGNGVVIAGLWAMFTMENQMGRYGPIPMRKLCLTRLVQRWASVVYGASHRPFL